MHLENICTTVHGRCGMNGFGRDLNLVDIVEVGYLSDVFQYQKDGQKCSFQKSTVCTQVNYDIKSDGEDYSCHYSHLSTGQTQNGNILYTCLGEDFGMFYDC